MPIISRTLNIDLFCGGACGSAAKICVAAQKRLAIRALTCYYHYSKDLVMSEWVATHSFL